MSNIEEKKESLLLVQEVMLDAIHKQNEYREQEIRIREEELLRSQKHDELIRKKIDADLLLAESNKEQIQQLEKANHLEKERILLMEKMLTDVQLLITLNNIITKELLPKQTESLENQHKKIDMLIEIQKLLISWFRGEKEDEVTNLMDIIRKQSEPGHVNVGTTFTKDFNAQDVNVAEGNANITQTKK